MTWTLLLAFALLTPLPVADDATPQDQVASLATALTKGDARAALELFDSRMPSFADIKSHIQSISALPNMTCTIEINRTLHEADSIRFETDWSLDTYGVQNGPLLQRRDKVTISLHQVENSWKIVGLSPLTVLSPPDDGVFKRIAALASDLNDKNQFGAIGAFSSQIKQYGDIDNDIDALITQNDVLCAIDVVNDRQSGDIHTLDLDWYFQLKSRADGGPLRERRERVSATMKKIKGKWQIIAFEPLKILSPEIAQ